MLKYVLSILLVLAPVMTFAEDFVAGKDYVIIQTSEKPATDKNKVTVTEFFSYGCPWCYRLEPALNQWVTQQGTKIAYNRVPVVFNQDWEYYAKAYYAAQALAQGSKLTPALFKAVLDDKRALNSTQAMIEFFISQGVNAATAQSAFQSSPAIDLEVDVGKRKMAQYQISGVPALIVNNQFKTDLQMAKTQERLFTILDFLISKVNKEKV